VNQLAQHQLDLGREPGQIFAMHFMEKFNVGNKQMDLLFHHHVVEMDRVYEIVNIEPDFPLVLIDLELMLLVQ